MEFKLESDTASYNDRPRSSSEPLHTESDPSGYHSGDPGDDYYDPEEDTVYIANRYQNAVYRHDLPKETTETSKKGFSEWATYSFFVLSVACFVGAFLKLASLVSMIGSNAGSSAMTCIVLVLVGRVMVVVDSIIVSKTVSGVGAELLFPALASPTIYYFRRCRANSDSSVYAWIAILLIFSSMGYSSYKIYGYSTDNPSSYNTYSNTSIDMDETAILAGFEQHAYQRNDQLYYLSRIVKDNVIEPEYHGTTNSSGEYELVTVTGKTTLYGKKQNIEMQIGNNIGLSRIKIGFRTYGNGDTAFSQVFDDLIANTTPNVP